MSESDSLESRVAALEYALAEVLLRVPHIVDLSVTQDLAVRVVELEQRVGALDTQS